MRKFRLSLVEDNIVLSSSCYKPCKHAQLELVVSIDYENTPEVKRKGISHMEWDFA